MINNIKSAYDRVAGQLLEKWKFRNSIYHDRLDQFASNLKKGDRLLDIGCGFGRDVVYFSQLGICAKGIDISSGMIETGKSTYGNINIEQDDIYSLSSTDLTKYQGIWVRGVLFHYKPQELIKIFDNIARISDENAILYIQSSNKNGMVNKNISSTNEELTYYFHSKEFYIEQLSNYNYELYDDLTTELDICLIFKLSARTIQ